MKRVAKSVVMATSSAALLLAGAGMASATGHSGASAEGVAANSPGVLSGNLLQVPVHVPVNLCGNTVDIIGLLNPAFGNTCVNA